LVNTGEKERLNPRSTRLPVRGIVRELYPMRGKHRTEVTEGEIG
jgi:hypothetical protein